MRHTIGLPGRPDRSESDRQKNRYDKTNAKTERVRGGGGLAKWLTTMFMSNPFDNL